MCIYCTETRLRELSLKIHVMSHQEKGGTLCQIVAWDEGLELKEWIELSETMKLSPIYIDYSRHEEISTIRISLLP